VSLWEFSVSRDALADLAMTCFRFAVSFLLIVVLGLPLGILVSRFRRIGYALSLPMDFFRSLPAPALFPIFMLFLGIGDLSRVGLTIFSGSLIVAVYTNHGIQNCPQIKIRAAKSCGAQGFELFRRVVFREAMPEVATGLRVTLSVTLILILVLEMLAGGQNGLGRRIYDAHLMFQTSDMYASVIVAGFLGYTTNILYLLWRRRHLHWAGR
jgi:NitT/TauT family transport system permease protein